MKVVHVVWEDPAFSRGGWLDRDDFKKWALSGPSRSDSFGLLAYEDESVIVLVQSVGNGVVADGVKITRSAVKSMDVLCEVPITLEIAADGD